MQLRNFFNVCRILFFFLPSPVVIQGQEIPIYIWYENYPTHSGEGYEGRVSRVSSDSPFGAASLNLTNIRESDQGWYECKVVFLNRSPNQHKNGSWFHLDVHAPPRFSVVPDETVYVNLGKCKVFRSWYTSTYLPIYIGSANFRKCKKKMFRIEVVAASHCVYTYIKFLFAYTLPKINKKFTFIINVNMVYAQ